EGIAYRIVDEYEDLEYLCNPNRTRRPLTLGELVALIDGARDGGGAAMSAFIYNAKGGGDTPGQLRNFVQVSSEFYPQLGSYYAGRIESWLKANGSSGNLGESS